MITNDIPCLRVTELANQIRIILEEGFRLIRVRGEISGVKLHGSGHLYFALKDQEAVIDGVVWRARDQLGFVPQDGMEVVCTGRLTTYAGRSKYQIIAQTMEVAGEGELLRLVEERKKKLAAEGLFDQARKRPLPAYPRRIAVITSPTGAVIRDIIHRVSERFPLSIDVWPVAVQGPAAPAEIVSAFASIGRLSPDSEFYPDVIVLARGGGSIEDLWAFHDEAVVRAVAASQIPVISAVGHETDTTLVDYAADVRAPTPTAAAEMATPVRLEILANLSGAQALLSRTLTQTLALRSQNLQALVSRLDRVQSRFMLLEQRLDDMLQRINLATQQVMDRVHHRFLAYGQLLESYSYVNVLKRGFAIVMNAEQKPVTRAADMPPAHEGLALTFFDGVVNIGERKTRPTKPHVEPVVKQKKLF